LRFATFGELATLKQLSITVNALAAIGDVLIAGVLCMVLHRSRTGFHRYAHTFLAYYARFEATPSCYCRSDTMINKLVSDVFFLVSVLK
jgi:hypothetical protein